MKKNIFLLIFVSAASFAQAQGYSINFKSNVRYGQAYLAYYMGTALGVQDSAVINKEGTVHFKGATNLPGGIYTIVYGDKKFSSDFLIDKGDQNLTIIADTLNPGKTNITGSRSNTLFAAYQNFVAEKGHLLSLEKQAYDKAATPADKAAHEKKYNEINNVINDYRYSIINKEPGSMMTSLLNAMKGPAQPTKVPVTTQDSLDNYNFYKDHYWDGFAFNDDRLVRTPFFQPRLEAYYRTVLPQGEPESIIKDLDYKLLLARTSPEMYKYLLNWFTDEYINPKYMGQDAIFVHLFEKYHNQGLTPWLNEKQMKTITDRAYMQMANLIGAPADNIQMLDVNNKIVNLYDVKANYTLMLFWDPTCGHCKLELPKIDSIYRASWKAMGMKIFAVLTEKDTTMWKEFIATHHLEDWINVYQTPAMAAAVEKAQKPGFRQSFDVTMTPTILLLDDQKRIIAKKLGWDQVNDFLLTKTGMINKN